MLVRIIFHPFDDLSGDYKKRIESTCLTTAEKATWQNRNNSWILTFNCERTAIDVIQTFETEHFNVEEFAEIAFRG